MNVEKYAKAMGLTALTNCRQDKTITDAYIGDLLSVVMGNCDEGNVWITVQTHPNILTVADLNDVACVVIAGDTAVEQSLIDKAEDLDVCLFKSEKEAYELAWRTHEVLK